MKSFYSKILFLSVLLCGSAFVVPLPAEAQKMVRDFSPPMPEIELLPQKEFEEKTVLQKDAPGGDKSLSYQFRLPKDWKKPEDQAESTYQVSNKILGELARFYGPPMIDVRSNFSIQALTLDYDMSAENWLLQYLLSNGYTVQGIKEYSEERAEALFVKVDNGESFVIRGVAQLNGKRVVFAQYAVPGMYWDQEKQQQAQVTQSFELTSPVKEFVEEMTRYPFLDISEFYYPASWEFKPAPLKNADRMSFQLLNVASEKTADWTKYKVLNGRIQVDIISYQVAGSVEKEMDDLKRLLTKINLEVGDKIETRTNMKLHPDVTPAGTDIYTAVDTKNNIMQYEYWMTPLEAGEYYYFVSLITPSRDEDFFVWLRNWRTYKLVIENFKPLEEGLIYR